MKARFTVDAAEAGQTLAAVLRRHVGELAWSQARRLVENGKVSVDGQPALDPTARVRRRQEVILDEQARRLAPVLRGRIVYDDVHVVVLDKPAGVSSVPYELRERDTAMDLVRAAWRAQGKRATETPLHVVHRIDKETSGLLAFAKTKLAERALGELFRGHEVERTYLCVAHGAVKDMRIDTRLVVDRGDGLRGSARRLGQGKRAITHVRVLEKLPQATVCEVRLETGKTHQIRIHLAECGHPLVGERVYIRDWLKAEKTPLPSPRLLLHAATLGFAHPVTGAPVRLQCDPPEDFQTALAQLR